MTKNITKILLVGLLCLMMLVSLAAAAQAQGATPATPTPTVTPVTVVGSASGDQIAFSQLITSDITLTGPFDSNSFLFGLPAAWQLTRGPRLDLAMAVSFNTAIASNGKYNLGAAGTLTIQMNNEILAVVPLNQLGEIVLHFTVPLKAMQSTRTDGLMELRFSLDSGWTCDYNENMVVVIHNSSVITLPHQLSAPNTDLLKFPAPIFQQGLTFSDSALVIIPDHPSAVELQSALTVAAGFGNLTAGGLALDLATMGQLTPQQVTNNHLILVGRAQSLSPLLVQLNLPMPVLNDQLRNTGGAADDGIVQLVDSPWSVDKAVLVVAGNTDAGVLKAAQALSTGKFRTNLYPNLAVVQQVQATVQPVSVPIDQTLHDLGYGTVTTNNLGVNYVDYSFYIPPGQTLGTGAYFELLYGHSALVNYARSGIVVVINGSPIGSVAFSDATASTAVNSTKFTIPPAVVHTGTNTIEVRINMIPVDRCTQPNLSGTYANIWPESNLHLPLALTTINTVSNFDLATYPAPFNYDPSLAATAFVLPKDDWQSWRSALSVARYLGNVSHAQFISLAAFYADNVPMTERSKYNLILIGRASQLPIVGEVNNLLPAPFAGNSDQAAEPKMQVTFRIPPNTAVGYVELLPSPWSSNKAIVAALGNTEQGVGWAASHLIEPLSWVLKGNFAVINGTQVLTADTRITSIASLVSADSGTSVPPVQAVAPSLSPTSPTPVYQTGWILPVLMVTILLIILTILIVVYINWMHNHSRPGLLGNLFNRNKKK